MSVLYRSLLFFTAILLISPLWLADYPTLVDMPDHLSRIWILNHLGDPGYPLAARYQIAPAPVPYLGIETLVTVFLSFLPPLAAMKAAISLILLLWVYGCHRLGVVFHGEPAWMAIPASLLCYHGIFQYGYLSFCLGAGFFLVLFSVWLRFRERWTPARLAAMSGLAVLGYFCHLATVMLLFTAMGIVALTSAWKSRSIRNFVLDLLPSVPTLLVYAFLVWMYPSGAGAVGRVTAWDTPRALLMKLFSPFTGYSTVASAAVVAVAAIGIALLLWSLRFRWLPSIWLGLTFLGLYLIVPTYVNDGGDVNVRFLVVAYPIVLLSLRMPGIGQPVPRAAWLGYALLIAAAVVHIGDVARHWVAMSPEIDGQIRLLQTVDRGATVYPAFWLPSDPVENKRRRHWVHIAHYATVHRAAYLPSNNLFAGMHLLRRVQPQPFYRTLPPGTPEDKVRWDVITSQYDYFFGCGLNGAYHERLTRQGSLAGESGGCALYRTGRPASSR